MKGNKRELSLRNRILELEKSVTYVIQSLNSLMRTSNVIASTLEKYISMNGDTEKFVKHLEKVIEDENKSSKKRKKKQAKGSGTTKTSSKDS